MFAQRLINQLYSFLCLRCVSSDAGDYIYDSYREKSPSYKPAFRMKESPRCTKGYEYHRCERKKLSFKVVKRKNVSCSR